MADVSGMGGIDPSYEDQRVFEGAGFTVSTGLVTVPSGNAFVAELTNPAGSGVNFVMTARVFSANMPLQYRRYATTATVPTGGTSVTINNRITGGAASIGTFRHILSTTPASGTISSAGFVPANYEEKRIKDIVVIAPGNRLIYGIGGAGGGLNGTEAIVGMTFLFYTRPA
jgi:hypothetical protein